MTSTAAAHAKAKPVGNRTGPRGHWPKGKPRNAPAADWDATRERLNSLLAVVVRTSGVSRRALADYCGVGEYTIRRWLSGKHVPDANACKRMRAWSLTFWRNDYD